MKKFLIKLLTFLLVAAMLLPTLFACKSDENENEGEKPMQFYVESALLGWDTHKICDFNSPDFLSVNKNVRERLYVLDGKTGYKWEPKAVNRLSFRIPEGAGNVQGYYYF